MQGRLTWWIPPWMLVQWHVCRTFYGASSGLGTSSRLASANFPRLRHFRLQLDRLAIHREPAASAMVDGFWIPLRRIGPGLEYLKDEEIVHTDETRIGHLAFQVDKALYHQRRRHPLGGRRSQAEFLELPHRSEDVP